MHFGSTLYHRHISCRPGFSQGFWRTPLKALLLTEKGKGSPYSITERRVPELIPVLGSQPAGDVSQKPDGIAITFSQACSYPRNP